KAPSGVCRSASTVRTTGTTLPRAVSRSKSSKVAGESSSMLWIGDPESSKQPLGCQPVSAVNYQHRAIDVTRRLRTKKHGRLLDVLDESESTERNTLPDLFLDRFRNQTFHTFSICD